MSFFLINTPFNKISAEQAESPFHNFVCNFDFLTKNSCSIYMCLFLFEIKQIYLNIQPTEVTTFFSTATSSTWRAYSRKLSGGSTESGFSINACTLARTIASSISWPSFSDPLTNGKYENQERLIVQWLMLCEIYMSYPLLSK